MPLKVYFKVPERFTDSAGEMPAPLSVGELILFKDVMDRFGTWYRVAEVAWFFDGTETATSAGQRVKLAVLEAETA